MEHSEKIEAAPPRKWTLARHPLILIPYALSIPLALLVPEDVFSKWTWAKPWFDFVAQYVPIVGN